MTRLLSRIPRRRAERNGADAAAPAAEATGATAAASPPDQPTVVAPPPGPAPAGTEPADPPRPGFRERSRLRRRLQYLRRVRELGFRDLGGLVFDQHRFARPDESLLQAKLTALAAVDGELRAIAHVLDDERPITELREVGVSACARCGALVGSDARYCSSCGTAVRGARDVASVVAHPPSATPPAATAGGASATPSEPVATPVAARLGAWAGGAAAAQPGAAAGPGEQRRESSAPGDPGPPAPEQRAEDAVPEGRDAAAQDGIERRERP
jgi:ribosomal protein L40E